jgi:hypothetical protein
MDVITKGCISTTRNMDTECTSGWTVGVT